METWEKHDVVSPQATGPAPEPYGALFFVTSYPQPEAMDTHTRRIIERIIRERAAQEQPPLAAPPLPAA
jgi:hypothetical protein